jgi:hypothetical protein
VAGRAKLIIRGAGLQPGYTHLAPSPEPRDLSYLTPATASSGFAIFGNDGNSATSWVSASGDSNATWQTDLGAPRTLDSIVVLFRLGVDDPIERENFEVRVSNSTSFAPGHFTLACTQGPVPLPYESTYSCALPPGAWRYVELAKTDGHPFGFSEVRVYGH